MTDWMLCFGLTANHPTGSHRVLSLFVCQFLHFQSYPMLHSTVSTNYDYLPHNTNDPNATVIPDEYVDMPIQPLGNRQAFYEHYMKGCGDLYSPKACQSNEDTRLSMIRRQPQSMRNYTTMGFQKIRAPDAVMKLLADFWQANREKADLEAWRRANIYTNHWEVGARYSYIRAVCLTLDGKLISHHHAV